MNKRLPEYFLGKTELTGTVTFSVLFAIVFLNLYIPFSDTAWFRLGDSVFFLFTAGFIAISVCILIASRILMYHSKKWFRMTYLHYVLWCFAEVIMISSFYTFVTVDVQHPDMPVAAIFSKALFCGIVCLIIPYVISGMFFAIVDRNRTIHLMSSRVSAMGRDSQAASDSQISLFDRNGVLRLSVRSSNLYYIESDDNYIKVWYTDGTGTLVSYMLRTRLKSVEESLEGSSMVRCNRKYIINMEKVKMLRKDGDKYYLDLDSKDIPPILVTKTYENAIVGRFS